MKKICTFLLCTIPMALWSQAIVSMHFMFQTAVPLGDFREASGPTPGYGSRFYLYVQPKPAFPLKVGLQGGFLSRGSAKETIPLNIAGFQDDYEIRAHNGIGTFSLLLQLEPWRNRTVSPYLEGEFGGNSFYSDVRFNRKKGDKSTVMLGKRADTEGRWAPFFGGSLGLKVVIGKSRHGGIDLKCSYLKGGKVSYNAKPRFDDQGTVIFDRLRSTTDMLMPQVGFWIEMPFTEDRDRAPGRFSGD